MFLDLRVSEGSYPGQLRTHWGTRLWWYLPKKDVDLHHDLDSQPSSTMLHGCHYAGQGRWITRNIYIYICMYVYVYIDSMAVVPYYSYLVFTVFLACKDGRFPKIPMMHFKATRSQLEGSTVHLFLFHICRHVSNHRTGNTRSDKEN